jgi:hypothetical protein
LLVVSFAAIVAASGPASTSPENVANPGKLIHVVVALCDNKYQGIVRFRISRKPIAKICSEGACR